MTQDLSQWYRESSKERLSTIVTELANAFVQRVAKSSDAIGTIHPAVFDGEMKLDITYTINEKDSDKTIAAIEKVKSTPPD